ncbi:hypothetical protein BHE74_00057926 [Ensete ventricosum]|nr:hypothetical protein BHE74_00057926 [Ensete ventricosum]
MDDELLQSVKALQNARAELPRQPIDRYKESIGFKEGPKRMGRVTYKYGYRVALARFHALHPNSEVEEDPFTIHPEGDLVPMERQQAFDARTCPTVGWMPLCRGFGFGVDGEGVLHEPRPDLHQPIRATWIEGHFQNLLRRVGIPSTILKALGVHRDRLDLRFLR